MKRLGALLAGALLLTGCGGNPEGAVYKECQEEIRDQIGSGANFESGSIERGDAPGGWYAVGNVEAGGQEYRFECAADEDYELTEARARPAL